MPLHKRASEQALQLYLEKLPQKQVSQVCSYDCIGDIVDIL